jgi:hypothetical protein
MYIGQSKKKCFKFSRAAPHRQDGSDTIPTSFIPSTIKMWNSLNNNIRNVDTLSKFKSELKKIDETENQFVPKHFFCGPRKLNIILTLFRLADNNSQPVSLYKI